MVMELKKTFFASGKEMLFLFSGDKSSYDYRNRYRRADGQKVTIVRPIVEEESPGEDVSSMYIVKVPNGGQIEVFEDELAVC